MAGSLGAAARALRKGEVGLIVRPCDPGAHHFRVRGGLDVISFCGSRCLECGSSPGPTDLDCYVLGPQPVKALVLEYYIRH